MSDEPTPTRPTLTWPSSDINEVRYSFSCPDLEDRFVVTGFDGTEELNRPYHLSVRLTAEDEATDSTRLLGREGHFAMARGENHVRDFYGIVCRVTIRDNEQTMQTCTVEIAPALRALGYTKTSRVFQDQTALQIVEAVLTEGLGPYEREIDASSVHAERLLERDYCVQYQESNLDFVHRLLEEEGIGYYFTQDGREKVVLFDDNRQVPRARTMDSAPVRFDPVFREWVGAEPLVRFLSSARVGSTSLTVRDHDWTRGRPALEETSEIGEPQSAEVPRDHELYEHGFQRHLSIREDQALLRTLLELLESAVLPGGLPLGLEHMVHNVDGATFDVFSTSDISHQLSIRKELLNRDAKTHHGISLVTDFSAGRTFELIGHPTLGADGDYVLTKVVHSSEFREADNLDGPPLRPEGTNYHNRFECLPAATPWRPDRSTKKPRIYGVQTARVTGPMGLDVYTDAHGRIRVQFQWDRAGTDPSGNHSCWLRVSQTWAGHNAPGFLFIPRVGMEVVVSFVDGDPDRPLVTGCVYNGANPTPGLLPIQATKSFIRTRTVPHGGPGYNELSFEDAMGRERVHIRAQRDLDELVLQNHITDVRQSQNNYVGADQNERVGKNQRLDVRGTRKVTVLGTHSETSMSDHQHSISGDESLVVGGSFELDVEGGTFAVDVQDGECILRSGGPVVLENGDSHFVQLSSADDESGVIVQSGDSVVHVSEEAIELTIGGSTIRMTTDQIQINGKTFPAQGDSEEEGSA